jgi:hypothetical protein
MFWQYAGPIVRGIHAGQSVSGHGQVGRQGHPWVGFGVTWPVGGRPYFDFGWPVRAQRGDAPEVGTVTAGSLELEPAAPGVRVVLR